MDIFEVTGVIRLGQFLKLANLAESGAHARELIADGEVAVDGEIETRRGRQLVGGEVVEVRGESLRLVASPSSPPPHVEA